MMYLRNLQELQGWFIAIGRILRSGQIVRCRRAHAGLYSRLSCRYPCIPVMTGLPVSIDAGIRTRQDRAGRTPVHARKTGVSFPAVPGMRSRGNRPYFRITAPEYHT